MSVTLDVYPCNGIIPKIEEVAKLTEKYIQEFLRRNGINKTVEIKYMFRRGDEVQEGNKNMQLPNKKGMGYVVFKIKNIEDRAFISYFDWISSLDDYKDKAEYALIRRNEQYPYYWSIEGRNYFRGFVAIAIAEITQGFIDSDDGGWDINLLPAFADDFFKYYNEPESCINEEKRQWFKELKQDFIDSFL